MTFGLHQVDGQQAMEGVERHAEFQVLVLDIHID